MASKFVNLYIRINLILTGYYLVLVLQTSAMFDKDHVVRVR